MKRFRTVARNELRSFVDHPTAYILAIAFLALALFLALRQALAGGIASMRPLFDLLPWLLAIYVPAVTMRSIAEERRGHTLEWLMGHPVSESDVVIGKFMGNWLFVLAVLAGTLPTALAILALSDADPGIMAAQYAGAALLAAEFVAIGLAASAATRNQITAFVLATATSLTLVLLGTGLVQIGLSPLIGGAAARLSVLGHFESVARGVIDLRDVLYFVSSATFFLILAVALVSKDRLSTERGAFRRLRIGVIAVGAVVVLLNLLGGYVRGRLDLTRQNLYTLADGTRQILGELEDVVTIKLVSSRELPPEVQLILRDVRDLMADFDRAGEGLVVVQEIDPGQSEESAAEASALGITPIEFNVLRDDEFQVKRGWFGMAIMYADDREVISPIDRTDDLEYRLASSIASMTQSEKPAVAFVTDFGASGPFQMSAFRAAISSRYDVQSIELQSEPADDPATPDEPEAADEASAEADSVADLEEASEADSEENPSVPVEARPISPDSVPVLVLAGPTTPIDSAAVERLGSYLADGGGALLLLEGSQISLQNLMAQPVATGLDSLLMQLGISLPGGIVYDLGSSERISLGQQGMFSVVTAYPFWPIAFRASDHALTRDLTNVTFGWASPIEIRDSALAAPLWTTTDVTGVAPAFTSVAPQAAPSTTNPDSLRPRLLAVAIDPQEVEGASSETALHGRVVVVGDAQFLQDDFVGANPQNLVFAANAIDWLAQDEALIRIRSKNRTPPALTFTSEAQQAAFKWGSLIGVPLLLALFGTIRVTGRVARARRRWKGMADE
jgi:ABC-type transport system involved in multi-copper enzyme maturation permease subunit/ABC-type uncharacterized transport system involved in gliding motility auxiliary subunit